MNDPSCVTIRAREVGFTFVVNGFSVPHNVWITAIFHCKRLIEKERTKFKLEHKQRNKLLVELVLNLINYNYY